MNDEAPVVHFNDRTGNGLSMLAWSHMVLPYVRRLFVVDKRLMRSGICRWIGRLSIAGLALLAALGLNGPLFAQQPPVVYVALASVLMWCPTGS